MHFFIPVSLLTMLFCVVQTVNTKEQLYNERNKTMKDTKGNSILLRWETIDGQNPEVTGKIRQVSDILIETYTQQELAFARKHPEAVKDEHFLKSLATLFESSTIDWRLAESEIRKIFQQFFTTTDFGKFSKPGESHIFVTAIDKATGKTLGVIQFIKSPDFQAGSIKAGMFGIDENVQDQGLQEILMSSILKLMPDVQKIFVHVRSTNEKTLALYQSWGFIPMAEQQGYWMNMEYNAQKNALLQKRAELLD